MRWPNTLTEHNTISAALSRSSLARFGDGEFNIMTGSSSVSQRADPALAAELRAILEGDPVPNLLPCIPNLASDCPRQVFWWRYRRKPEAYSIRPDRVYGSSFISRPDNAPWIDNKTYWKLVEYIWKHADVALVSGDMTLANIIKPTCNSMFVVCAPKRDAYSVIDQLEKQVDGFRGPIIIALGAAGTALAARLARKGLWALDLGHIGMFMNPENIGAFAIEPDRLVSPQYRKSLEHAHRTTNWGRGGASWADPIAKFAKKLEAADVLDYGAGGRTLAPALAALGVKCKEYDPGVPEIAVLPKLADVVASTDVFEHIEPENVANVLQHVYRLARKGAFLVIAKQPAKKILDDGRNAHLTCRPTEWWIDRLVEAGWKRENITVKSDEWKKCVLHCLK